jgi:hypothetical protein
MSAVPSRAYAPAVATTPATVVSRTERECLRAAGLVGLGVLAAAVLLWADSFPGWPLAAGVVLSTLLLASLLLIAGREPPPAARWLRPAGVVAALVVAVGGGILVERSTQAALLARFEHSRPAFDAAVADIGPVPVEVVDSWLPFPGDCPNQLGSYRISACHGFAGGYMFLQARNAWGDDAGFAYAPDGPLTTENAAVGLPSSGFTHLVGPWYAWTCRC